MLRSPFKEEGLNLYGLFQKITAGSYPPISDVCVCRLQCTKSRKASGGVGF